MAFISKGLGRFIGNVIDSSENKLSNTYSEIIAEIKSKGINIPISESVVNGILAKNLLSEDIREFSISIRQGLIVSSLITNKKHFGGVCIAANLTIEKFCFDSTEQLVILRQVGKLETAAEGWIGKIGLWTSEAIISGLLNKSLLHFGLKDQAGVCVENDLITIDLKVLGLGSLLEEALLQKATEKLGDYSVADYKVGQWAAPLLTKALSSSLKSVGDILAITGAACEEGKLVFNVGLVKAV